MPRDRGAAEARLEAFQERLGERDLREQHERLLPLSQALGDRLEIDFGLARARHAVEQHRIETPFDAACGVAQDRLADCGGEAGCGVALAVVELGRRMVRVGAGQGPVGIDRYRLERAGIDQPAQNPVADSGMVGELADRALAAFERGQCFLALGRQPVGHVAGRPILDELSGTLERRRGRQYHPQHRGERRQVIVSGPFAQAAQRCGDRRHIHHTGKRPQPAIGHFIGRQPLGFPDDAEQLPRPQRRDHDRPGLDVHALGHPVIERPERYIQGDDTGSLNHQSTRNAANAATLRVRAPALARDFGRLRGKFVSGTLAIGAA